VWGTRGGGGEPEPLLIRRSAAGGGPGNPEDSLVVGEMKLKHFAVAIAIVGFSTGALAKNVSDGTTGDAIVRAEVQSDEPWSS